jgi:hypothetical protein
VTLLAQKPENAMLFTFESHPVILSFNFNFFVFFNLILSEMKGVRHRPRPELELPQNRRHHILHLYKGHLLLETHPRTSLENRKLVRTHLFQLSTGIDPIEPIVKFKLEPVLSLELLHPCIFDSFIQRGQRGPTLELAWTMWAREHLQEKKG